MRIALAALTLAAPFALATAAQAAQAQGPYAHGAIQSGDYGAAERQLAAEARVFPNKPEVLLNLAAIYTKTGRVSEARALYNRVLALEPVAMDVVDGRVAPSHLIANRGLHRLETAQIAAR